VRPSSSHSEVIQRYYGFMLGFITNLLLFEFAKPGYRIHRRRIDEALADLGAEIRLPARHAQFRADKELRRAVALELRKVGKVVTDFYVFGSSAFCALIEPSSSGLGRSSRGTLYDICSEYNLDVEVVKLVVRRNWAHSLTGNDLIHELVSRAYDLAGMPIRYAQKEDKTRFVIMPFTEPFRDYYSLLYAPALRLAGYEPLRAWEGVTNERYLRMLFELVHRCGAGLADLSAPKGLLRPNLNVIHEIGMNMAAGNITYLIRQPGRAVLPSNFIGLPMMTYYPKSTDWPGGQVKQIGRVLREIVKGHNALMAH
jgi:hypothetical protein